MCSVGLASTIHRREPALVAWAEVADLALRLTIIRLAGSLETALATQPIAHAIQHALSWILMAGLMALGTLLLRGQRPAFVAS